MTTIYVHNNYHSQNVTCSDGTQGALWVSKSNKQLQYNFNFYDHAHLGFWLDKPHFHDGEAITVKGVLENDQFKIKFIS